MAGETADPNVFGTLAESFIISSYASISLVLGILLLLSLLLPYNQFRGARLIVGVVLLMIGAIAILWFESTLMVSGA
jgi:ABC-type tungstate transport system substrate-binding protein